MEAIVEKQSKYATRNPIARALLRRFLRRIADVLTRTPCDSVLEVGCGEGLLLHELRDVLRGKRVFALDVDADDLAIATRNSPFADYARASGYALPFRDRHFDLVLCCEVLEHLEDPRRALRELHRVAARHCILSVPREPFWRALNLLRGTYVSDWGNTPGHLNHWSAASFRRFAAASFEVVEENVAPFPWTGVLCRVRGAGTAELSEADVGPR